MSPAIDNSKREIAPSKGRFKNLLQKMFKKGRNIQSEDSSMSISTDSSCSSNETIGSTGTKKQENLENSQHTTYIEKSEEKNVDVTTKIDFANTKINYTVEEVEGNSLDFSVELSNENTTMNEAITQNSPATLNQIEEPIENVQEECVKIQDWNEILEQWEIIDEDIPETGSEALEFEPEEPTLHKKEINVNRDSHDVNEQEIDVSPESHDANEQEIDLNPERHVNEQGTDVNPEKHEINEQKIDVTPGSHDVNGRDINGNQESHGVNEQEIDVNRESHDANKQEIYVNPDSHDANNQEIDVNQETPDFNEQEVYVNPESHDVNEQEIDMNSKSNEVNEQEIYVNRESRDSNTQDIVVNPKSHDANKQEIDINPESHDANKQEIGVNPESHDANEPEIHVNPESHEDNECSTGFKKTSSMEEREVLLECSVTSEPWEYQYEKYIKMYSKVFKRAVDPERHVERESSTDLINSSRPVKRRDARIVYPLKYPMFVRKQKHPHRIRRIFSLESLLKNTSCMDDRESFEDAVPENYSVILKTCELQCENIISTYPELLNEESEEPTDIKQERVVEPGSLEENESLPLLENADTLAKQNCTATLEERESQNENINKYLETMEKKLEESSDNKHTGVFNPDSPEENKSSPVIKTSEDAPPHNCSATLKTCESQCENIISERSETMKKESEEPINTEEERCARPASLEENESLSVLENASCVKKLETSPQRSSTTLEMKESQYDNIINSCSVTPPNGSKETTNNEKDSFLNPDSLEENEPSPDLENAGFAQKGEASETVGSQRCSTTLEEKESQYDNITYTYSETVEIELVESTDNEQERVLNLDYKEDDYLPFLENAGCKTTTESSEAVAPHKFPVTFETCKSRFINRCFDTPKKESNEPTTDNEEKTVLNPERLEEINHSDDLEASGSSNNDEGFLRRHILVLLCLLALLFFCLTFSKTKSETTDLTSSQSSEVNQEGNSL